MINAISVRRLLSALGVTCLGLIGSATVTAQQNTVFGGSGALSGSSGFGSGGSIPGLTSGFGGTAFGRSGGTGMSATGQAAGMSNTLGGLSATGGGLIQGAGGPGQQRTSMVGAAGGNNNRFVGSTQTAAAQGGRNNQNGLNNRGQNGNRLNRGNNNNGQQNFTNSGSGSANAQRVVRPQLRVAFDYPRPTAAGAEQALTIRFDKISKRASFNDVKVDVEGGKATLRGEVDTEDNRKLAAMLVAIEPGVRSVQNDLTVRTPPPPPPGE